MSRAQLTLLFLLVCLTSSFARHSDEKIRYLDVKRKAGTGVEHPDPKHEKPPFPVGEIFPSEFRKFFPEAAKRVAKEGGGITTAYSAYNSDGRLELFVVYKKWKQDFLAHMWAGADDPESPKNFRIFQDVTDKDFRFISKMPVARNNAGHLEIFHGDNQLTHYYQGLNDQDGFKEWRVQTLAQYSDADKVTWMTAYRAADGSLVIEYAEGKKIIQRYDSARRSWTWGE